MSRILKNYFYNILYNMFVLLVPLITAPYLARVLGAERLGIYSYVSSSTSVIMSVSLFGIYSYGNRQTAYMRDDGEEMSQMFWDIMGLRAVLGIFGTIVYIVYARISGFAIFFRLFYIYYLANVFDCTWLFVGLEDMKIPALKNMFAKILSTLCIFLFVKSEQDIGRYIFLLSLSTMIANILAYPQLRKYIKVKKIQFKNFKKYLWGSVELFLPSFVATIYLQVDKVMIGWLTNGTSQISYYDQAEKIVIIPLTFITVLSTVMMPRIANEFKRGNQTVIGGLLEKAAGYSMFLALPMMFGLMGIAYKFIPWYLGRAFMATAKAVVILSPMVISNTLIGISGSQYFTATNQMGILLKSNAAGAALNIAVNTILIPRYGYIGAAIATLFSNYTLVGIQFYYLNRQVGIKNIFNQSARYFLYSLVMFIVVFLWGHIQSPGPIVTLEQIFVGGAVYCTILFIKKDPLFFEIFCLVKKYLKSRILK